MVKDNAFKVTSRKIACAYIGNRIRADPPTPASRAIINVKGRVACASEITREVEVDTCTTPDVATGVVIDRRAQGTRRSIGSSQASRADGDRCIRAYGSPAIADELRIVESGDTANNNKVNRRIPPDGAAVIAGIPGVKYGSIKPTSYRNAVSIYIEDGILTRSLFTARRP